MSVVTVCPNIDLNLESKDVHLVAPTTVSYQPIISNNYNNGQCTFTCPPPSKDIFVDRCPFLAMPFCATFGYTTTGTIATSGGNRLALRAYPLANIINNTQVTVESQNYTLQVSEIIPYLARFWEANQDSSFPDFLDPYAQYSDGIGSFNNPLSGFDNAFGRQRPRGSYPLYISDTGTGNAGSFVVTIAGTVIEPLWSQLFVKESDKSLGITNVSTLNIVVNFNAYLGRMFSFSPPSGVVIDSFAMNLGIIPNNVASLIPAGLLAGGVSAPTVYFKYSSPPESYIPQSVEYRTDRIDYWPTQLTTPFPTPGVITNIQTNNNQLGAIPDSVLVFVRDSNAALSAVSAIDLAGSGMLKTDSAMSIQQISVTFDNVTSQLSTANEMQLYEISKSNMLQDLWEQWNGFALKTGTPVMTSGSFFMGKMGKDITLKDGRWVGQQGQWNLQISLNVLTTVPLTQPTVYIMCFTPEKLILSPSGCEKIFGLGVASPPEQHYITWENARKQFGAGGSFSSTAHKMLSYMRPIHEFTKRHRLISRGLKALPYPVAQSMGNFAESYGYGDGGGRYPYKGHGDVGGMSSSKQDLIDRIKNI